MLEKTKKALKEEFGKIPISCDPAPTPVVGIVKIAKTLKEDFKKVRVSFWGDKFISRKQIIFL